MCTTHWLYKQNKHYSTNYAKDLHAVMPMYNLIEYSDIYSKTSWSLWQYYRVGLNDNIVNSESFQFKINITEKTPADGNTKDVKIAVLLKCLSNFCRTPEIPLISSKINLILTCSENCVISSATGKTKLSITDTKLYVLIVNFIDSRQYKTARAINIWFQKNN